MYRRDFITLLGGAAAAWPLAARAQQPAMPVIGYLNTLAASPEAGAPFLVAFRKGLDETGYIEGRNVTIELRWAHADLAADLVRRRVAVIVAVGDSAPILAVEAATATIPIVFATGADPVAEGLVMSLNRPGGNVTGMSGMAGQLAGKQLGLLHQIMPGAMRFFVLVNPTSLTDSRFITDAKAAASTLGLQLEFLAAEANGDIDVAFATLAQMRASALLISPQPLFIRRRVQLATLAAKHSMATCFCFREQTDAGGLMSYGPSIADVHRQVGIYTGRILKGEKASDLPVMQASKFELVINLQTAKLLGIEVPPTLLALADEVIE